MVLFVSILCISFLKWYTQSSTVWGMDGIAEIERRWTDQKKILFFFFLRCAICYRFTYFFTLFLNWANSSSQGCCEVRSFKKCLEHAERKCLTNISCCHYSLNGFQGTYLKGHFPLEREVGKFSPRENLSPLNKVKWRNSDWVSESLLVSLTK